LQPLSDDTPRRRRVAGQGSTIKIGAIFSKTGPAANLGGPEARTLEMLVQETNKKGGLAGYQIELIVKDSGSSPKKRSRCQAAHRGRQGFRHHRPSTSGEP